MAGVSDSELPRRAALEVAGTWRRLNFEQRVAGIGALLLVVSTFGPFTFVEAAIVLIGLSVLFLLRKRAQGREFHIPFGDGGVIAAAGMWSAVLIVIRLFDRPLGQGLLALVCAGVLIVAGLAERRKRPPDDLPGPDPAAHQRGPDAVGWEEPAVREPRRREDDTSPLGERRSRVGASDAATEVRRSRRESSTPVRAAEDDADTNPLGEPQPAAAPEPGTQLELSTDPPPPEPKNDPLPPPEFRIPGEEPKPPPGSGRSRPR
jgi:hypothetical protein